jgi:hypothetical protein
MLKDCLPPSICNGDFHIAESTVSLKLIAPVSCDVVLQKTTLIILSVEPRILELCAAAGHNGAVPNKDVYVSPVPDDECPRFHNLTVFTWFFVFTEAQLRFRPRRLISAPE